MGKKEKVAVQSEMKQLHMRDTFISLHRKYSTEEQSNTILESYLLLKDKRDGNLKFRKVAYYNNQRYFISKEYAISLIVATK